MDCLPPPEPLVLTNTPADNWKKFRQRIELYFKATETNKKRTPAQKAAIFLHVAGPEAIEQRRTGLLKAKRKCRESKKLQTLPDSLVRADNVDAVATVARFTDQDAAQRLEKRARCATKETILQLAAGVDAAFMS
ncbi:hypothetical protein MRX96_038696 [Rhipicephalus microplus]